jgi:hypothetical protein
VASAPLVAKVDLESVAGRAVVPAVEPVAALASVRAGRAVPADKLAAQVALEAAVEGAREADAVAPEEAPEVAPAGMVAPVAADGKFSAPV